MRLILGQLLVGLICSGTTKKLRWCLEPDYMCPYIHGKPSIEFTFFLSTAHSLQTHSLLSLFQHIKRKPSVIDCRWNGLGYFPWIECINFHFATNVTLLGSSSSRPIPSRTPDLQRKKTIFPWVKIRISQTIIYCYQQFLTVIYCYCIWIRSMVFWC